MEVRAQGENITDYLTVCNQAKVDTHVEHTSENVADTTTLAIVVNAVISIVDAICNGLIAVSIDQVFFSACFFVLGVKSTGDVKLWVAIIMLMTTSYLEKLQVSDTWIQNLCLMAIYSLVWWLVIVFIIYRRDESDDKDITCTEVVRYLFVADS